MKKLGGVTIAVATVLLCALQVEPSPRGGVPRSGGPQLKGNPGSQRFNPGPRHGFQQHHSSRPHPGFSPHHGFRQPPFSEHHSGAKHRPHGKHHHGGKRHLGGVTFFVGPPYVVSPFIYGAAPLYVTPPVYYWYYCQDPAGYYPYVPVCPTGWILVAPH